jgi:antitoxin ParD1/3/4
MANVEKLSVALTSEMATVVRQAVKDGEYASHSEVIREALRDWTLKRSIRQKEVETLRGLWQEGLQSGTGRFSSMAEIKAESRNRLEKQSKSE